MDFAARNVPRQKRLYQKKWLLFCFVFFLALIFFQIHRSTRVFADMATYNDQLGVFPADSSSLLGSPTPMATAKNVNQINSDWTYVNGPINPPNTLVVPSPPGAYEMRLTVNGTTSTYNYVNTGGTVTNNCDVSNCYGISQTFWSANGPGGTLVLSAADTTCDASNNPVVQLTWGPLAGVQSINVYRNGSPIYFNLPGTSIAYSDQAGTSLSPPAKGTAYSYYIQAIADDLSASTINSNTVSITTSYCPSMGNLNMTNINPTPTFAGLYGSIGRQQAQGGSNWMNPVSLTPNITLPSPTPAIFPVNFQAVAFYDKRQALVMTNLTDIESKIQSTNTSNALGFIVGYAFSNCNNKTNPTIDCPVDSTGFSFQATHTYVYFNGTWKDITSSYPLGTGFNDSVNNTALLFTVVPTLSKPPYWNVSFDRNFGNRSMYTAGYTIDNVNVSSFKSTCTLNIPSATCNF